MHNNAKKILFIMNAPAPYWVSYSKELSKHHNCKFIFYSTCEELDRPPWWDVELPNNIHIVRDGVFRRNNKFIDINIFNRVKNFSPDIIYTSGVNLLMTPFLYYYCRFYSIKFLYHTEIWRTESGKPKKFKSALLGFIFKNVDIFYVADERTSKYWAKYLGRKGNIKSMTSPGNMDRYSKHLARASKQDIQLFFGHRLIDIYNPILALDILRSVQDKYPSVGMYMNEHGDMHNTVVEYIKINSIKNVKFIEINKESDLDYYYSCGDISISPAKYSYGNIGTNEAMASGMPVLISENVEFHSTYIKTLESGFILPMDKQKFVEKIIDYIESENLLHEHSLRSKNIVKYLGVNVVLKKFNAEINALF